jgi:hypothetical protein
MKLAASSPSTLEPFLKITSQLQRADGITTVLAHTITATTKAVV